MVNGEEPSGPTSESMVTTYVAGCVATFAALVFTEQGSGLPAALAAYAAAWRILRL